MKRTKDKANIYIEDHFEKPEPIWSSVLRFLRDAIIRGDIKPGDKLKESVIALKLGISRAPVREALRILEVENFVESYPQKGSFVKQLSVQEIDELFFVLKSLFSSATKFISQGMDDDNRKKLKKIIKELNKIHGIEDIKTLTSVTSDFHDFIIYATNNSLLIKIYESFFLYRLKPYMVTSQMEKKDLVAINKEPIAIGKALLQSDVQTALKLTDEHLDNARIRVLNAFKKSIQSKLY